MTDSRLPLRLSTQLIFAISLFLLIAAIKSPGLFLDPRLWAEEGKQFFEALDGKSFLYALTFSQNGNYQIFTSMAVYVGSLVPPLITPWITTFATLGVHLLVVVQIVALCRAYKIDLLVSSLFIAAWATLPATYEVWMTATNAMWIFGVSTLLLLMMPPEWMAKYEKRSAALLLICGLSGLPAVLTAPAFLIRAVVTRSPAVTRLALLLLGCGVFQAWSFYILNSQTRGSTIDPFITLLPVLIRPVGLLQGDEIMDKIGAAIFVTRPTLPAPAIIQVFVGSLMLGCMVFAARVIGWRSWGVLLFAYFSVTLAQYHGSLDDKWGLFQSDNRYSLFASMCICLFLVFGSLAESPIVRRGATVVLAVVVAVGAIEMVWSQSKRHFLTGPSWSAQVYACAAKECQIAIWPPGWTVLLKK